MAASVSSMYRASTVAALNEPFTHDCRSWHSTRFQAHSLALHKISTFRRLSYNSPSQKGRMRSSVFSGSTFDAHRWVLRARRSSIGSRASLIQRDDGPCDRADIEVASGKERPSMVSNCTNGLQHPLHISHSFQDEPQTLNSSLFKCLQPLIPSFSRLPSFPPWLQLPAPDLRYLLKFIAVAMISIAIVSTSSLTSADAFVVGQARKLQPDELATIQLFKESTPAVVYITNLAVRRDVFTLDVMEVPQGSGSGFVWDLDGHIVTNYHVIRGASDLRVTLGDQSVYEAVVVGFDQDKDVAVLYIDAPKLKLHPLPVGSSSNLMVGQKVFAIGNPFGLDHTLTTGVISGLRREISSAATGRPIQDVIQTDAAINPGNSGGPLLDSSGNLIGINTAIYSPSGASSGVGFSIPVDTVSGIVEQIVKFGKVTRPVLGISFAPEQAVEQLGVQGVLVLDAPPSGPAGKAGLRATKRDSYGRLVLGDIIVGINGQPVKAGSDLYKILDRCKVGETVIVEVLRGDQTIAVDVTLEAKE
eukprot:TRINITY_DN2939_c0_g1_i1.p1 TRINITY_DN2939_c0_g1~~TRINITY_DN2939_c0_g1_i1.p1  ORF type:complete len:550 (+),score=101.32 TRINITY_DN2939_c0_g1_i1:63-1652(+)